jgi:hypothetical protein
MSNDIGHNPFNTGHIHHNPSINPFSDPGHGEQPVSPHANQQFDAPPGLHGRPSHVGGDRPRQNMLPFGHGGGHGGPGGLGGPHELIMPDAPDYATMVAIAKQHQQTINSTALAESTAEAQSAQGLNEFYKSMAEMAAKNNKSAGEKLAGLA